MSVNGLHNQGFEEVLPILIEAMKNWENQTPDLALKKKLQKFFTSPRDHASFKEIFGIQTKDSFKKIDPGFLKNRTPFSCIPSSGTHLGSLTFRLRKNIEKDSSVDLVLGLAKQLKVDPATTLIISAYPAKIEYPPEFNVFECPGRPDQIESLLEQNPQIFDNYVLVCQSHFLNYLCKWSKSIQKISHKLKVVIGGNLVLENQRKFFWDSLNINPETSWVDLFGLAEVSVGIGVKIGSSGSFRYNPSRFYFETENSKLIVTSLDKNQIIPAIRYETGDLAEISGIDSFYILGKKSKSNIRLEAILDSLFSEVEVGKALTGRICQRGEKIWIETWNNESIPPSRLNEINAQFKDQGLHFETKRASQDLFTNTSWDSVDLCRKVKLYD